MYRPIPGGTYRNCNPWFQPWDRCTDPYRRTELNSVWFFFSLFFFLPPLVDTARNRPPMVEIDCYRSISGGEKQPQSAIPPGSKRSAY
ncbi:hypothetical protein BHE74_00055110 [Ensete ventricosum]|nr:hypothetical protein GW17_00043413 [Ensete ventricosum]RWW39551.1 hypothetical protein BHE74_00055110 [Ensete ventricosum]